jgi:MEDS: MEthanogen/methylotroph, DcmR Sensory domain
MEQLSRHRCLIYEGPPSRQLPALAFAARQKLQENYRCFYLNSPSMVVEMQNRLEAVNVDVAHETARASLVLSSAQHHLSPGGRFDVDRMISSLKFAVDQSLHDGYRGLWASGDMIWEFGPEKDFSQLLEYEWRLEEFFHECHEIVGVCLYRADMLPAPSLRHGLASHRSIFVSDKLSVKNSRYLHRKALTQQAAESPELDHFVNHLVLQQQPIN